MRTACCVSRLKRKGFWRVNQGRYGFCRWIEKSLPVYRTSGPGSECLPFPGWDLMAASYPVGERGGGFWLMDPGRQRIDQRICGHIKAEAAVSPKESGAEGRIEDLADWLGLPGAVRTGQDTALGAYRPGPQAVGQEGAQRRPRPPGMRTGMGGWGTGSGQGQGIQRMLVQKTDKHLLGADPAGLFDHLLGMG